MKRIAPHLGLASSIKISNVWLIEDGMGRRFLIDTGFYTDRPLLLAHLWKAGIRSKGDLNAVLLTHRHTDHAGNADWLRKRFDCPIVCHSEDAAVIEGRTHAPKLCRGLGPFYTELLCAIEDRFPVKTRVDEVYEEGTWKWGFQVLHTPGHTEGSVMLFHEPSKTLFSGDSIVSGPPPFRSFEVLKPAFKEFSMEHERCHETAKKWIDTLPEIQTLCSGHGPAVQEHVTEKLKHVFAQASA